MESGVYKVLWVGSYLSMYTTVFVDNEVIDEEFIIDESRQLLIDYHNLDPYQHGLHADEIELLEFIDA